MDWYEERASTPEGRLGLAKAELRYRAVEVIADALERSRLTQKELAERLGVSTGRVSQVLGGDQNLRLNTLAEYLHALGRAARLDSVAATEGSIRSDEFQVPSRAPHVSLGRIPTVPIVELGPINSQSIRAVPRVTSVSVAS